MPDRSPLERPYTSRPGSRSEPRRWARESFFPFRLEVLTPVFIGTGGDLSPLEYVIRQKGDDHWLHLVDTASWLQASQDMGDVRSALDAGDMLRLRRLMDEHLDTALYSLARVPLASALAKFLRQHITDPDSLSKAEIQAFPRSPVSMAPYVPGSSLKGALSTALIDCLDVEGRLRDALADGNRKYTEELKRLFGPINAHSMQAVKVSDVPVPPGATRIVAARESGLTPGDGTPKTPCEVLVPVTPGHLPLYGRLLISMGRKNEPGITLPNGSVLTLARLAHLCNAFYQKRFRDELTKFYRLPHLTGVGRVLEPVLRRIETLDAQKQILLRVGHYSHVECVTVTDNAPKSPMGFGGTRTLAGGVLPFGWVVLNFCAPAEYEAGAARVQEAITDSQRDLERGYAAREEQIRRSVEEERKRLDAAAQERAAAEEKERLQAQADAREKARSEEERRRREREAAEREAMLAALSPEERAIAEVAAPDATDEMSMRLYARLDSLEGELQVNAARALRDCWQRLGKWQGSLSKKQLVKVAKVKQLLCE